RHICAIMYVVDGLSISYVFETERETQMSSNQRNSNVGHNSQANAVDKILSDVMRGAKQDGKRQAELTIAMFQMEVTYSADAILNVFRKEGKDKTEAMDKIIRGVSDSFVKAQDQIAY